MIQIIGPTLGAPTRPASRRLFNRIHPLWSDKETHRRVLPIRHRARKTVRSPFGGNLVVAAANRIERGGLPHEYRLTEIARKYESAHDCEQLVAILAGRLGDPSIPPNPPVWPILGIILLEWQTAVSIKTVLARAGAMGFADNAQRGLILLSYLFPELQEWVAETPLPVPFWETALAAPFAARKLVLLEKTM